MLTRQQFQEIYEQGPDAVYALIVAMQQQIDALTQHVEALEERLNRNSHNSNLPPSSDGFKRKPTSLRKKTGRKPGGQPGHPGGTLEFVPDPDQTISHSPRHCASCGACLAGASVTSTARRQVWDLPELFLIVTEHQAQTRACPRCQQETSAAFPATVSGPVGYGPRVKGLLCYLSHFQLLPFARVAALMEDLFGVPISQGTLARITQQAHQRLSGVAAKIGQALIRAKQAHFDETGVRIGGQLYWQHVSSNDAFTYYACHKKRGRAALVDIGILPRFGGRAIHDGWSAYRPFDCQHALCNAHHLRELTGLEERQDQPWATQMKALLQAIKAAVDRAKTKGKPRLSSWRIAVFEARYDKLLKAGYHQNAEPVPTGKRGRPKQGTARSLLLRLSRHKEQVLAFMYDFSVPFDNNLAERDLRMMKLKQKVSGGFRSQEGAEAFCRIRGYLSTMRKQGHNMLDALLSVFEGRPLLPAFT